MHQMARKNLALWALLLLAAIPLWLVLAVPALERLPSNFTYRADLLSLDNFYDSARGRYPGSAITKSNFSYSVIGTAGPDNGILIIQNSFDVRQLTGERIFAVNRSYGIDAYTGMQVSGYGDENRTGYLFAPAHLQDKRDFTYWHVNYDVPATMRFQGEEEVDGLPVYHYQSVFTADQTPNLGNLPNVGVTRGVRTNVTLDLWVEPLSGHLVKYADHSLAYYYDLRTGAYIEPWDMFNNRYTPSSIADHAQMAREQRDWMGLVEQGVPAALVLLSVLLMVLDYVSREQDEKYHRLARRVGSWLSRNGEQVVMVLAILAVFIGLASVFWPGPAPPRVFTIGISAWGNSSEYTERIAGFKESMAQAGFAEGRNVTYLMGDSEGDYDKQLRILQGFSDAHADLIYSLSTRGTLVAKGVTNTTPIVFSLVMYPMKSGLIDSLTSSGNNLVGTRNYIPPALQFYAFEQVYPNVTRLGFVHHSGESESAFQFQEFRDMLAPRGIKVVDLPMVDLQDIRESLPGNLSSVDAIYLSCDALMLNGGGPAAVQAGLAARKPSMACSRSEVEAGALVGDTSDARTMGRVDGQKAALILEGVKPTWLHTDSTQNDVDIINLGTARALGLAIPPSVLGQADEVING
ncbi:MAG: DUF3068 domain-containing protein [Candidatus Micrarchaeota archaeon]|nr:DUF3068 domain-containing protein [Candidatus Micrarchaeota archaeon]